MSTPIDNPALLYHSAKRAGKIEVVPTKPYCTPESLSMAYTPGVAAPALAISANRWESYRYTNKGNLVGIISNGSAVLGLGNIGALAAKPVMEGKSMLFKIYADIDAFDIEIGEDEAEKLVSIIQSLAFTFGGINLEDIKSPECFYIEEKLNNLLQIPVFHDDQHGTAVVICAGLLNALHLAEKSIEEIRIVLNGAGAAGIATARMLLLIGVPREHIVMLDSKGVIRADREELSSIKRPFATHQQELFSLVDAMEGADVFIGLSQGGILNEKLVNEMAPRPILFALANPIPEIDYHEAKRMRPDALVATGRTDLPNQINNVLCFPYLFHGALDTLSYRINDHMKLSAVWALANLARQAVPYDVKRTYGSNLKFGADYFIPKPNDTRLITEVSISVARAAMQSGVARQPINDWDAYRRTLRARLHRESRFCRELLRSHHNTPLPHKRRQRTEPVM